MGTAISKQLDRFFYQMERKVLFLGLDFAGKTTILYRLKLGIMIQCNQTISLNTENIEYNNIKFTFYDFGLVKPLWKQVIKNTQGIIFVVDSSDLDRVHKAREELQRILDEKELKGVVLLVFANKQDMEVMSVEEINQKLSLYKIKDREWFVKGTSALNGKGIYEGLKWLSEKAIHEN